MGGEFTYQPKWDPTGFDPLPLVNLDMSRFKGTDL